MRGEGVQDVVDVDGVVVVIMMLMTMVVVGLFYPHPAYQSVAFVAFPLHFFCRMVVYGN